VLDTAGRYLARAPLRSDVQAVYVGLRPLVKGEGKTSTLSRDHMIHVDGSGLLTVTGGTNSGTAPVITQQPSNQTVTVGGTATFSVTATGSPVLSYLWLKSPATLVSSSTSPMLTLSNVQPSSAGNYFVIVSNMFGTAASSNAVLTVTNQSSGTAPVITQQPSNQTVTVGGTATFSVTATGSPVLRYLWFLSPATLVANSTSPTLTISNVQPSNAGHYFVIVSNAFGSAASSNVVLTVTNGSSTGSCIPPVSGLVAWWPGEPAECG